MFRNETKAIARKVHVCTGQATLQLRTKPQVQTEWPTSSHTTSDLVQSSMLSSTSQSLYSQSLYSPWMSALSDHHAVCFYFSNYAASHSSEQHRNLDDYLRTKCSVDADDHLLNRIVTAIGQAGISCKTNDPSMLLAANRSYSLALRQLNDALQNPVTASSDQTLLSVFLLGLYEASLLRSRCKLDGADAKVDCCSVRVSLNDLLAETCPRSQRVAQPPGQGTA